MKNVTITKKQDKGDAVVFTLSNGDVIDVDRLKNDDGEFEYDFAGSNSTYQTTEDAVAHYIDIKYY